MGSNVSKVYYFLKSISIILLLTFAFSQCKKESDGKTYQCYFYTSNTDKEAGQLYLYINGSLKGELPYMPVAPTCKNDSLQQLAYHLPLVSDTYHLEAKTDDGTIVADAKVFFSENSNTAQSRKGSEETYMSGQCVSIGLGK